MGETIGRSKPGVLNMVEMTVLHIASPFAFTAPVSQSDSGNSTNDGQNRQPREAEQAKPAAAAQTREAGTVDARDSRLALSRAVDLATPASDPANSAGSLDAVLAAYEQESQPAGDGAAD